MTKRTFMENLMTAMVKYKLDSNDVARLGVVRPDVVMDYLSDKETPTKEFIDNFYLNFGKEFGTTILLNSFGVKKTTPRQRGVTKRTLLEELIQSDLKNLSPEAVDIMLNVARLDLNKKE